MYDIQKASVLKRLSAFLFDFIFIAIISVGIAFAISGITNFYGTLDSYQAHIDNYAEEHGIKLDITEEEYNALSEDERKLYEGMGMELFNNEDFVHDYELIISLTLVMVTLSPFVAFLMLEFLVPLFLKNGQTLGKKIFAIGVVRMDSVRLTPLVLFARNILGKFTIGTMIPHAPSAAGGRGATVIPDSIGKYCFIFSQECKVQFFSGEGIFFSG